MFDAIARLIDVGPASSAAFLLPPSHDALGDACAWLQAHPAERAAAASYHSGLTMAVDALAASAERCDEAFFLLEGWAKQVGGCGGASVVPAALLVQG
jgi:hypothetical protein